MIIQHKHINRHMFEKPSVDKKDKTSKKKKFIAGATAFAAASGALYDSAKAAEGIKHKEEEAPSQEQKMSLSYANQAKQRIEEQYGIKIQEDSGEQLSETFEKELEKLNKQAAAVFDNLGGFEKLKLYPQIYNKRSEIRDILSSADFQSESAKGLLESMNEKLRPILEKYFQLLPQIHEKDKDLYRQAIKEIEDRLKI